MPLAEPVERDLRTLALPILEALADSAAATANLVLGEGDEHVRALLVVEPRVASIHVAFQPGQLDRIDRGSAGLAILASRQPQTDERPEVADTRRRGYAVSFSEVIPSVFGVSAFVPTSRQGEPISIGLSVFQLGDEAAIGRLVTDAATRLGRALG